MYASCRFTRVIVSSAPTAYMSMPLAERTELYRSRLEMPWRLARNPYDFHRRLWALLPKLLVAHLENGIGHAKAFGCGLLLVRRVS